MKTTNIFGICDSEDLYKKWGMGFLSYVFKDMNRETWEFAPKNIKDDQR